MSPLAVDLPQPSLSERSVQFGMEGVRFGQTVTDFQRPAVRLTMPAQLWSSTWLRPVISDLERTVALDIGWDSYEGLPTTAQCIERAMLFLGAVLDRDSSPPCVVPLSDGGVQLVWNENELDIEATFPVADEPELYIHDLASDQELELNPMAEEGQRVLRSLADRLRA